jgi:hypothetical protein
MDQIRGDAGQFVKMAILPKPCECCGGPIPIKSWMKPCRYHEVRFCSRSCSNRVVKRLKPRAERIAYVQMRQPINPHRCWRDGCPNYVPVREGDKPSQYADRRYCSPECQKGAAKLVARKPRGRSNKRILVCETIDEFIARGGVIAKCPPGHAFGAEFGGYVKGFSLFRPRGGQRT